MSELDQMKVKDEEIKTLREIVQRQHQMLEDRFHLCKTLEGERNALLEVIRMFTQPQKAPPQAK